MRNARIGVLVLFGCLIFSQSLQARTQRFAVIIGNNRGYLTERTLRYAEDDARKVRLVLAELGGFDDKNIRLLLGKTANNARAALKEVERLIESIADDPEETSLLFVYFSGHAEGDALEMGSSALPFQELSNIIKSSKARVRLSFIDSCQSGKLVAAKGGRRGPEFQIKLNEELHSSGYAIVTSSAADELSQESTEIHGSFFTHYLISGLRGAADRSHDGKVTLAELYQHVYQQTVGRTSANVGGGQHPMYDFQLSGRGDLVLTHTAQSGGRVTIEPLGKGRIVILDAVGAEMVAEINDCVSESCEVFLAPGRYQAYWINDDKVLRSEFEIRLGEEQDLKPEMFQKHALKKAVAKGGLFRPEFEHTLGISSLMRRYPLAGGDWSYGGKLIYRLRFPSGLEPTIQIIWTKAPDFSPSSGYWEIGGEAGLGYGIAVNSIFDLRAALLIGYDQLTQSDRAGIHRTTAAFVYGGLFTIDFSLGRIFLTALGIDSTLGVFLAAETQCGARLFRIRDHGVVHRFDLQNSLTLSLQWD
jgi:hypothetical protein